MIRSLKLAQRPSPDSARTCAAFTRFTPALCLPCVRPQTPQPACTPHARPSIRARRRPWKCRALAALSARRAEAPGGAPQGPAAQAKRRVAVLVVAAAAVAAEQMIPTLASACAAHTSRGRKRRVAAQRARRGPPRAQSPRTQQRATGHVSLPTRHNAFPRLPGIAFAIWTACVRPSSPALCVSSARRLACS